MSSDDPNFFKDWMDDRRLKSHDVADALQVSEQTIRIWRSSGVPERRVPHVERFMKDWVDPSSITAKPEELRLEAFIMRPDEVQFDNWNRAANAADMTIREWIKDTLERAAEEFAKTGKLPGDPVTLPFPAPAANIAEDPPITPAADTGFWLDLRGGVAAGSPISSHVVAEPIPALKPYPPDHYALRVFGQSMEPKVPDGSLIVVRQFHDQGFPRKGTIVVYSDATGSTLKAFGYRKARPDEEANSLGLVPVLSSLNPAFPNVDTLEGGRIDAVLVDVL